MCDVLSPHRLMLCSRTLQRSADGVIIHHISWKVSANMCLIMLIKRCSLAEDFLTAVSVCNVLSRFTCFMWRPLWYLHSYTIWLTRNSSDQIICIQPLFKNWMSNMWAQISPSATVNQEPPWDVTTPFKLTPEQRGALALLSCSLCCLRLFLFTTQPRCSHKWCFWFAQCHTHKVHRHFWRNVTEQTR